MNLAFGYNYATMHNTTGVDGLPMDDIGNRVLVKQSPIGLCFVVTNPTEREVADFIEKIRSMDKGRWWWKLSTSSQSARKIEIFLLKDEGQFRREWLLETGWNN